MNTTFTSISQHLSYLLQETPITLCLIAALIVFITINSLRQKHIQGLPCWPILGMVPSLILGIRVDLHEFIFDTIHRVNKTTRFKGPWFSSFNFVFIWEPHNIQHMLKTNFSNFPKGRFFRDTAGDLLGDGIFNADGEVWLRQRKTSSIELFHSPKFRELTTTSLLELVHCRLLPFLEHCYNNKLSFDLQDVLLRLTFDNVCMVAFGVDPGSLAADNLPAIPFAVAFRDATEATAIRFAMPTCIWKTMRYFNFGTEKWLRKSLIIVNQFVEEVIQTRKKESSDGKTATKSDLLTVFLGLKDEEGKAYTNKFMRDICVNFILAGRDTSSLAMSWFFWVVGRNPAVEERIEEELCRVVEERENGEKRRERGSAVFTPAEVKKMEYLQAALYESLRLYPSVPLDYKEAVADDVFPDGTIVKKGTKVIYPIYSMGRMEAIWGKDCMEYKPERWLKDGVFSCESAYKFTAFNGGPRLCLGKDFANYQMKFVVASVLYRYRVKVVDKHIVVPKLAMTLYMKYGLKVNLHKRDA